MHSTWVVIELEDQNEINRFQWVTIQRDDLKNHTFFTVVNSRANIAEHFQSVWVSMCLGNRFIVVLIIPVRKLYGDRFSDFSCGDNRKWMFDPPVMCKSTATKYFSNWKRSAVLRDIVNGSVQLSLFTTTTKRLSSKYKTSFVSTVERHLKTNLFRSFELVYSVSS